VVGNLNINLVATKLYFSPIYALKTYAGMVIWRYSFLNMIVDKDGQPHAPAVLPPVKSVPY
jgi:hypothetical protein